MSGEERFEERQTLSQDVIDDMLNSLVASEPATEENAADKPSNGSLKLSPVLTARTQPLFAALERKLGHPFAAYWHSTQCQIGHQDVDALAYLLNATFPYETLGLFVKSDGGNGMEALRFIHFLRKSFKRIILFAPFECASAATMLALGCDEIHMGPGSFLTAVDTTLNHPLSPADSDGDRVGVSQDVLARLMRLWREQSRENPFPEIYKHIHPMVVGALDRASSLSIRICRELLSHHMKDGRKAEQISRELNSTYPSHSYPITSNEALRLGLNIRPLDSDVESILRALNHHYSEMGQHLRTDRDEEHHHDNQICHILERLGRQIYFQKDQDWYYRADEKRWLPIYDNSAWHIVEPSGSDFINRKFYIG